jgi:hypothetical protein
VIYSRNLLLLFQSRDSLSCSSSTGTGAVRLNFNPAALLPSTHNSSSTLNVVEINHDDARVAQVVAALQHHEEQAADQPDRPVLAAARTCTHSEPKGWGALRLYLVTLCIALCTTAHSDSHYSSQLLPISYLGLGKLLCKRTSADQRWGEALFMVYAVSCPALAVQRTRYPSF